MLPMSGKSSVWNISDELDDMGDGPVCWSGGEWDEWDPEPEAAGDRPWPFALVLAVFVTFRGAGAPAWAPGPAAAPDCGCGCVLEVGVVEGLDEGLAENSR